MSDDELKPIYSAFTDAWKLYRQFSDVKDTEQYWKKLAKAAQEYNRSHSKTGLSTDLAVAVIKDLEKKASSQGSVLHQFQKVMNKEKSCKGGET